MEHPLSVLLSKVLELNGSLADAHRSNDFPLIARRWLELQQSLNVLFDSNTAKGNFISFSLLLSLSPFI
jgi:DNA-directed RNA polymerase I subunit RPA1